MTRRAARRTKAFVRLVPVSIGGRAGIASRPGTGDSSALGSGGGGGRIATIAVGWELAPWRCDQRDRAADGADRDARARARCRCRATDTAASSPLPRAAEEDDLARPRAGRRRRSRSCCRRARACATRSRARRRPWRPSGWPRTSCRRCRIGPQHGRQRARRQRTRACAATRRRVSRSVPRPLFLRPTGLADGLAPEERRYGPGNPADSPPGDRFRRPPNGSPVPRRPGAAGWGFGWLLKRRGSI